MNWLQVALGGALGSVLRFWLGGVLGEKAGAPFWGTIAVNVLGSFLIGICAGMRAGDFTRHFLMIGILGGFTTFSSFSLQTLELLQRGSVNLACANVALSLVLCMLGVWLGHVCGRAFA
jgi:fluoride exporter